MSNLCERSEEDRHEFTSTASLHHQHLQCGSHFGANCDEDCDCETWDVKPDLSSLLLKQAVSPGLSLTSEQQTEVNPGPFLQLPASSFDDLSQHDQQHQDDETIVSTQHRVDQADTSMDSAVEYSGLYIFTLTIFTVLDISKNVCI